MPAPQVAAARGAVTRADHDMRVHGRLAVVERDVAGQAQQLDLLVDRDLAVLLGLPVEGSPFRPASAGHIFSFTPLRISHTFTGQAVKKPTIIPICIINQ